LPLVLYGHETWCPALREEHILHTFENEVLWKIHGPKKVKVSEQFVISHNTNFPVYTIHRVLLE